MIEFVLELPYVIWPPASSAKKPGYIPPFEILNELLLRGKLSAGMSGNYEWEPFEVGRAEYEELDAALKERGFRESPEPPDEIVSVEQWMSWRRKVDQSGDS